VCHSIFCFAVKNSSCEFCRILKEWFLSFFGAGGLGGDSHSVETKCEGTCWCRYEASDFVFVVCFGLNFMNVRDLQRVGEREREREREPFCGGWGSNTIKSPDSHNTPQLDYVLAEAGRSCRPT
jgi:hypothetical protein